MKIISHLEIYAWRTGFSKKAKDYERISELIKKYPGAKLNPQTMYYEIQDEQKTT